MKHILAVVSPHIRGPQVTRLQKLLKVNWTGQDFLQGGVDGDFGPETGRACARAKYWLGYAAKEQKPLAGGTLLKLLHAKTVLPKEFMARRQARLKKAKRKPLRLKALDRALKDVGMKEKPPNSNWSPISRRWGIKGPWCAMSVSEWYIDSGSKAFILHDDFAYVPYMLAAAERGQHGLAIVRDHAALPGDIVCFDWDDDGVADHTGLIRRLSVEEFDTVEGNTGLHNDSNGGRVMERERDLSDVATFNRAPCFIRVGK